MVHILLQVYTGIIISASLSVVPLYNPSLDEPHVVTASYNPSWLNRALSYSYRPGAYFWPLGLFDRSHASTVLLETNHKPAT